MTHMTTDLTPRAVRLRLAADDGLTLVELIVATLLVSILGAIVTTAVITSHKQVRLADDEATGLGDVKTVIERLGRDIRGSRGVDAGATQNTLRLWIDYNSDYIRSSTSQADEIITWSVVDSGDGRQFNTLRSTAGGSVRLQADTLVSSTLFCYKSTPLGACLPTPLSAANAALVKIIEVEVQYDSQLDLGTDTRTTKFVERIRNVS
jgi:prepilin-type N-terminal cleavage/methylation domain-containing protein